MEAGHESANVSYGIYDLVHNVIQDDSIVIFFKNVVFISCTNDNYRIGATPDAFHGTQLNSKALSGIRSTIQKITE
jgi:hypothetical protein